MENNHTDLLDNKEDVVDDSVFIRPDNKVFLKKNSIFQKVILEC